MNTPTLLNTAPLSFSAQGEKVQHLCIKGDMTIYQAAELKVYLLQQLAQADALDVDLSAVSEIDTTGLQLLIALKGNAKPVHFKNPSHSVDQLFSLLKLHDFFAINARVNDGSV